MITARDICGSAVPPCARLHYSGTKELYCGPVNINGTITLFIFVDYVHQVSRSPRLPNSSSTISTRKTLQTPHFRRLPRWARAQDKHSRCSLHKPLKCVGHNYPPAWNIPSFRASSIINSGVPLRPCPGPYCSKYPTPSLPPIWRPSTPCTK